MQAAADHDRTANAHSSATRPQLGRVIVAAFISVSLIFMVASLAFQRDESVSQVVVDPKLQRWPLTTALYVAFVQFLTQVLDPGLQLGEQQSVLRDAGGTNWKVVRTWILPKAFFGGNSEGVTHLPKSEGRIFTGMDIIRRTEASYPFHTVGVAEKAIPANFSSKGYSHIGDVSTIVYQGKEVLLTSLEEPTYTKPLMMVFTADTLEFVSACPLNQRHTSLLAVDAAALIMYSTEFMDVTQVKRYAFPNCTELAPLRLFRDSLPLTLQGVQVRPRALLRQSGVGAHAGCGGSADEARAAQGGAVLGDTLYLSTNQIRSNKGDIFAVDTATGNVQYAFDLVCGMGVSEMEGIDVWAHQGQLRMLVAANFLDLFCTLTELHNQDPQHQPSLGLEGFWRR